MLGAYQSQEIANVVGGRSTTLRLIGYWLSPDTTRVVHTDRRFPETVSACDCQSFGGLQIRETDRRLDVNDGFLIWRRGRDRLHGVSTVSIQCPVHVLISSFKGVSYPSPFVGLSVCLEAELLKSSGIFMHFYIQEFFPIFDNNTKYFLCQLVCCNSLCLLLSACVLDWLLAGWARKNYNNNNSNSVREKNELRASTNFSTQGQRSKVKVAYVYFCLTHRTKHCSVKLY